MSQKLFLALLVMATLLSAVSGHQYCADSSPTLESTEIADGAKADFDYLSYFMDPTTKESTPLMVKKGDASNAFTLRHVKSDGGFSDIVTCDGTEDKIFIGLQNQFLILSNSDGSQFKYCVYTGTGPTIPSNLLTFTSKIKSIIPLGLKSSNEVFLAATYQDSPSDPEIMISGFVSDNDGDLQQYGKYASDASIKKFDPARSFGGLVFNLENSKYYSSSGYGAQFTLVPPGGYSASVADMASAQNLQLFSLRNNRGVMTSHANDKLTGYVWKFDPSGSSPQSSFKINTAKTDPFKYFSDGLNNFARLTTDRIDWLVLTSQDAPAYWAATLDSSSSPAVTVTYSEIMNIGFTRNKMSVITVVDAGSGLTDTKITTYRMDSDGIFVQEYELMVPQGPNLSKFASDAANQFKITSSCMCKGIQAFTCFSQTLNCIVINKAQQKCGVNQDKNGIWA